jgi:1-acyl-sn-glycerol-3-phosphate acyltransferase
MNVLRATWGYAILILGVVVLGFICFTWALASLVLNLLLPPDLGRRVGRIGAMWCFRSFLAIMETAGAWRLDLAALDELRDAGPLIIAPNHPCLLDAVLVISRLPNAVCVMKQALMGNFLLGPASRLARYVHNETLIRLASHADAELRLGGQLLLFPEGTRSTADPIGPLTEAVGAVARHSAAPVQAVIIEADSRFLGKGWRVTRRPTFPLAYRVRLGRRFDPPRDVRAFTTELERYFTRELASDPEPMGASAAATVEDAHRIRG